MKFSSRKRQGVKGFTLVELLVVIGIIAILVAVVGASVGAALRYAKRTKASAIAVQIQTAVQNYYTEYGVYPTQSGYPSGGTGDAYYPGTSSGLTGWENLMYALCGNINPGTGQAPTGAIAVSNTRGIAFLAPSRSDLDSNSPPYGVLVNPFGLTGTTGSLYFYMAIDTDYTGVVGDNGDAVGQIPNFPAPGSSTKTLGTAQPVTGGVAVWCPNDQPLTGTTSNPALWSHTY